MDGLTPPLAPRAMPEQVLFGPPPPVVAPRTVGLRTALARALLALFTLALTAHAAREMHGAASPGGIST
ncbi:MAG: hypothetical protein AAGF49_12690, partial [Pseudomonadota bacterium]